MSAESIDRSMHPLFQVGEGGSTPTSALQLRVEPVAKADAAALNRKWHSVLPDVALCTVKGKAAAYAASFEGRVYAVAIWSDPVNDRMDDGETIELRRMAVSPDAPRFTASRMLSVMAKLLARQFPVVRRLISYQAVGVHMGTIYRAAGWTYANYSKFSKWGTRNRRKPRSAAQRAVAVDGYVTTPSARKPSQIQCDKVRWERMIVG